MFKKMIALVLIFAMLVPFSSAAAADEPSATPTVEEILSEYSDSTRSDLTAEIITDTTELVVFDAEREQQINELFALRGRLEINFEENEAAIRDIDNQLRQLGVEEISHSELLSKMGYDVLPTANVDTSDPNTLWTSRRSVVIYRGQQYEIQTIDGVPRNNDSGLRSRKLVVAYDSQRITAGTTEIFHILGITALGASAISELAGAVTIMDIVSSITGALVENLQPTTVIDAAAGIGYVSFSTHMRAIFVKGYGSSDSYQKLGYVGNFVTYNISTVIETDSEMGEHGSTPVHEADLNKESTMQSAYFDDYTVAVQNYYNYRNNVSTEYVCEYTITHVRLRLLGTERNFEVPYGLAVTTY
jgi:hypothetical protein